jgi:hypothetical protein
MVERGDAPFRPIQFVDVLILVPLSTLVTQFQGGLSSMSAFVGEREPAVTEGYWEQELVVTLLSVVGFR